MERHLQIKIYGQVQGVGFRYAAKLTAQKLNLKGFAGNQDDDSVLIEVEGGKEELENFLTWCRRGPASAVVRKVEFYFTDKIRGFADFQVL